MDKMDKMNKNDILSYWPKSEYEPRESQVYALKWLEQQNSKYIFLEAPVGFGKSLVGITYSRWLNSGKGNSFILVPQIILQKQYENEVIDDKNTLFSLCGKSNYTCKQFNTTCDVGSLLKQCKTSCSYSKAINKAKNSNNLIMNYTLALLMFGFTQMFDKRQLMICDEMHNLEKLLVDFNLLTISKKRTDNYKLKLNKFNKFSDALNWINDLYLPKVTEEIEELKPQVISIMDLIESNSTDKNDLKLLKKYNLLKTHYETISMFVESCDDTTQLDFVMISDNFKLEFKPVYGKDNFSDMISDKADKFLFMSGTILNKKQRCNDLGISENESSFLSLDSEFEPKNRSVIYYPGMKMNASWNDTENENKRQKYLKILDSILKNHNNETGVIHAGNFKISEYLVKHLQKQKEFKIYHHNPNSGNNRNVVIDMFLNDTKPRILVSPSVTEGIDLKYDKGRFAIIAKVPFPYLGDKWIKRRLDLSQEWYAIEATKDVIQAGGRVVRSKDDHGTTYIIDESFNYFYYKNGYLFPNWWKQAFKKINE